MPQEQRQEWDWPPGGPQRPRSEPIELSAEEVHVTGGAGGYGRNAARLRQPRLAGTVVLIAKIVAGAICGAVIFASAVIIIGALKALGAP